MEELNDVYQHFLLYYGLDIPKMKAHMKAKKKAERASGEGGGDGGEDMENNEEEDDQETLKQATKKTGYSMCVQAGLCKWTSSGIYKHCSYFDV